MTTRKSLDGKLYVGNPHVASMGLLMRICAAFLCAVFSLSLSAKTLYVDCNRANDDGPGTSEANAFRTIQAAVTNAAINDTIIVLPGEYAEGSGGEGGTMGNARVYVSTYGLTIRSKEGKAVTQIVGAPDPETGGAGPNALKCVFIATSHVTVEGFTLRGGRSGNGADTEWASRGGAAGSNFGSGENYLVDCAIYDTVSKYSAVFQVHCLRCEISGCASLDTSKPHIYAANLINCFVHDNTANNYLIWAGKICNTTVASEANYSHLTRACSMYNCIFDSGNGDLYQPTVTSNVSLRGSVLIAPAVGDCHPRTGTAADGTGDVQCIADLGVREDIELYLDFEGRSIPKTGSINLGCFQTAKAAAGGRIDFAGAAYSVDGKYPHAVAAYAYPETYPTQFMVKAATGRLIKGTIAGVASAVRTPDLNDAIALMPPAGLSQAITFTSYATEAELWVTADGNDGTGDGSQANPYRTIQHAIDAASAGTNTIVNVGPGTYGVGEAHYPVNSSGATVTQYGKAAVTVYDKCVRVVSTDGADETFIVGTVDSDYAADATLPGCGPDAARCVLMSGSGNNGSSVSGFTLTGGATARSGDSVSWGGGYFCPNGYNAVTDCIISNNAAHVCAGGYAGTVERCLFVGNRGDGSTAGGDWNSSIFGCVFVGNPASSTAGGAICGNAIAYNCTLIGESNEFPFAQNVSGTKIYNSIVFGGVQNCPNMARAGNVLWGGADPDVRSSEKCVDPLFSSMSIGDFRIKSISPAIGVGDLAVGSYFANATTCYGGRRLIFTDGLPLVGAVQELVECGAEVFVDVTNGGIVAESGAIGYNDMSLVGTVTLAPGKGTRPCIGYLVNGATNYFGDLEGGRLVISAAQALAAGGMKVSALYSKDWHVDANNGNDANPGCAAFPLQTLAASMENAAAGDTVHAAPGDYNQGQMGHNATCVISSRVVVVSGVLLKADQGPDVTFISGADATIDPVTSGNYAGCGQNALRCVYLKANSRVEGFTVRNGRFNGLNPDTVNSRSGGVYGENTATAIAYGCVITNCWGYRGGGCYGIAAVNCRFIDNRSNDGVSAKYAALYGCHLGRGYLGSPISSPQGVGIVNCTISGENMQSLSGTSTYSILSYPSAQYPLRNCVILGKLNETAAKAVALENCVLLTNLYPAAAAPYVTMTDCIETNLEAIAIGADGRLGADSVAIDWGDNAKVVADLEGKDVGIGQRIYNGRVDAGAYEFDWRPSYARTIHVDRCTVATASPEVVQGDEKVLVTGALITTFAGAGGGQKYTIKVPVNVTGNGRLDVVCDGDVLASYTLADGNQTFIYKSASDVNTYSFVYEPGESDTGCAEIGVAQWKASGFIISFR